MIPEEIMATGVVITHVHSREGMTKMRGIQLGRRTYVGKSWHQWHGAARTERPSELAKMGTHITRSAYQSLSPSARAEFEKRGVKVIEKERIVRYDAPYFEEKRIAFGVLKPGVSRKEFEEAPATRSPYPKAGKPKPSEPGVSRPGAPDLPGEARAKMIAAGVMKPTGEMKEITGYYVDPVTGTKRFAAKGEPLPTYQVPPTAPAPIDYGVAFHEELERVRRMQAQGWAGRPGAPDEPGEAAWKAERAGVFDVAREPTRPRWSWYEEQMTKLGMGGRREAEEYGVLAAEYERLQAESASEIMIEEKRRELEKKYREYETAGGVSPLAGRGIKTEETWAYKSHELAERLREGRVPLPSPPIEYAMEKLVETGAQTIEFLGSAPTVLRHAARPIAEDPSLMIPLVAVTSVEFGRAIRYDPVQTAATIALTAGLIKGGTRVVKTLPRPIIRPGEGIYGVETPSFKAAYFPKLGEYRVDTAKGIRAGRIRVSKYEKELKARIDRSIKKQHDFTEATYRTLKIEDIPIKYRPIEVFKPPKAAFISEELIFGGRPSVARIPKPIRPPKPELKGLAREMELAAERAQVRARGAVIGGETPLLRARPKGVRMLWREEAAQVRPLELMEVPRIGIKTIEDIAYAQKTRIAYEPITKYKPRSRLDIMPAFAVGAGIMSLSRIDQITLERSQAAQRAREDVKLKMAMAQTSVQIPIEAFRLDQMMGVSVDQLTLQLPKMGVPSKMRALYPEITEITPITTDKPKRLPTTPRIPIPIPSDDKKKKAPRKRHRIGVEYYEIRNPIASMEEIMWGRGVQSRRPKKTPRKNK
jgi:hypothetical protein